MPIKCRRWQQEVSSAKEQVTAHQLVRQQLEVRLEDLAAVRAEEEEAFRRCARTRAHSGVSTAVAWGLISRPVFERLSVHAGKPGRWPNCVVS